MRPTGWIVIAYALLVFLGGIFGYVKAESTPSLIMGVAFAAALSVSAFAMFNEKEIGLTLAASATAMLAVFFIYRFFLSYRLMPAGLMSVLSIAVLVFLCIKKFKQVPKQPLI